MISPFALDYISMIFDVHKVRQFYPYDKQLRNYKNKLTKTLKIEENKKDDIRFRYT